MEVRKNLLLVLGEWWETRRVSVLDEDTSLSTRRPGWLVGLGKQLVPNLGSVFLVLILLTAFPSLAAPSNGINATSISTIPYQGRLADASGNPVTGKQNMEFRIYDVPADGTPLWEEFWTGANSVDVSDGLFSVMLGSINTGLTTVVQGNNNLYLGITVGTDSEMIPRVQLGSVPFSIWSLSVADDSITSAKIADNAVGSSEIADGSVTQAKAPTLISSANGENKLIRYGDQVFSGTDENGYITITYPCFPHRVNAFIAVNGDWNANPSAGAVVGHNGGSPCSAVIKLANPTSHALRINWIAIGD